MEWYYKSNKYDYSPGRTRDLKVGLNDINALQTTKLFTDGNNYFISTTDNNKIYSFLDHHEFDEIDYAIDGLQEL